MLRAGRAQLSGALAVFVLATALASCTSPSGEVVGAGRQRSDAVVVASFNFPESELIASMYAEVLEEAGVPVDRQLALGPREIVQAALQQGLVDIVPEYLGTALVSFGADSAAVRDLGTGRAALAEALAPWGLTALEPAGAQNQNGLAVTAATAQRLGLRTVSDLAKVDEPLVIAGPPECPQRVLCLRGLRDTYGMEFAEFVPFDTATQRATALTQGVVDVAVVFTTDYYLAGTDFVLLEDDGGLQPNENIVPVATRRVIDRYGDLIVGPLARVSAALSSKSLTVLNWRVASGGRPPRAEAHGWLVRRGIVARSDRPGNQRFHVWNAAAASDSRRAEIVSTSRVTKKS